MAKKEVKGKIKKFDFDNEDGTVDEWVYDTSVNPWQPIQVTLNIRRRSSSKKK